MTLATVELDAYDDGDRRDMLTAIKTLTGRMDGLSTFGVYFYWAPETRACSTSASPATWPADSANTTV
ncbi:MAG TPA: hypothetical protein VNA20_17930 [Frankiaceae bacterium]|nr:hypothetical protein [Frankiaceae bacterium]